MASPRSSAASPRGAAFWLSASLVFPVAYVYWYRLNRGRIGPIFPVLLICVTAGIPVLLYLDGSPRVRHEPSFLFAWGVISWFLTFNLTVLFLWTRPNAQRRTDRLKMSDRTYTILVSCGLVVVAVAAIILVEKFSRVINYFLKPTPFFVTLPSVGVHALISVWAVLTIYLMVRLSPDAIARQTGT